LTINGIINLDKPRGKTSFGMVALIRRLSGERRVGHAGTLDPEATGVLPICLGQATRLIEFLAEATKVYCAEIEFGLATDTYDATGKITWSGDVSSLTREQVEEAVASFSGFIEQTPPKYSAIKYRGIPLYRWARGGFEVPRKSRSVELSRLNIVDWQLPILILEVECSKGTYIRSLAHDLGVKLGCGAHLRNLVRLKSGPFLISDAVGVSKLEEAFRQGSWAALIHPMDVAVLHLPAVTVDADDERAIVNGRPLALKLDTETNGELRRAYSPDGSFVSILRYDGQRGHWKPEKVFRKLGKA
jgi:tRNA pseudouridine55 synthase